VSQSWSNGDGLPKNDATHTHLKILRSKLETNIRLNPFKPSPRDIENFMTVQNIKKIENTKSLPRIFPTNKLFFFYSESIKTRILQIYFIYVKQVLLIHFLPLWYSLSFSSWCVLNFTKTILKWF